MRIKEAISVASLQYGALGINFILQIVLTYYLSSEIFGTFAKVSATREIIFAVLSVFHLPLALIANKTQDEVKLAGTVFYLSLVQIGIYLLGSIACLLYFGYSDFFNAREISLYSWLMLGSVLSFISSVILSFYERSEHFKFNSAINLVVQLATALIAVWLTIRYKDYTPLVFREILPVFILCVVYIILFIRKYKWGSLKVKNFDRTISRSLAQYSFKIYLNRAIEAVFLKLDILLVGKYFGDSTLGIYERVRYFAGLPQLILSGFISRVNFVKYTKSQSISLLQETNFLGLVINLFLFTGLFGAIYLSHIISDKDLWIYVFPLYLMFWYNAGPGLMVENIKVYLYATDRVWQAAIYLRIIPLVTFWGCIYVAHTGNILSLELVAVLFSLCNVFPIFFLKPRYYSFVVNPQRLISEFKRKS